MVRAIKRSVTIGAGVLMAILVLASVVSWYMIVQRLIYFSSVR